MNTKLFSVDSHDFSCLVQAESLSEALEKSRGLINADDVLTVGVSFPEAEGDVSEDESPRYLFEVEFCNGDQSDESQYSYKHIIANRANQLAGKFPGANRIIRCSDLFILK